MKLILIGVVLILSALYYIRKKSPLKWYAPENDAPREQCPCCDYISLPERGSYLICPICFWEDDGLDVDNLDIGSAPNKGISLREARKNFNEFGACEESMIKNTITTKERAYYEYKTRGDEFDS